MQGRQNNGQYPRPLSPRERQWLDWILPADRPGYLRVRKTLEGISVIGEGRRGKGEVVIGRAGELPDFSEPFGTVFAYGAIETSYGTISVTLREVVDGQISFESVSHFSEEVPAEFEELRRWTYSSWKPRNPCPKCRQSLREVSMHSHDAKRFVLALCPADRRLWVYDDETEVNRIIPVTNFYNELMLHRNIRDPKIALDGKRLFSGLNDYSDGDLTYAFFTYNKLKTKVLIGGAIEADMKPRPSLLTRLTGFLR